MYLSIQQEYRLQVVKFKQADDNIIQSICWQSYENSIIQAILNNMNLSQLNDKLQSVEKVIQFCQEKKTYWQN